MPKILYYFAFVKLSLKYITFLVLFICLVNDVIAGDTLKNAFFRIEPTAGLIIRHRESMGNLAGHVPSVRIESGIDAYGKNTWEQLFKYPEYGAGYYFADLGNKKLLGQVHAFYVFLNTPFIEKNKISLNYKFALGVSYITRHWDRVDNYENLAIGSRFNVYFSADLNFAYRLSELSELGFAFGACHYSNGATYQPNLGINVVSLSATYKRYINTPVKEKLISAVPEIKKKYLVSLFAAGGVKTVPPELGPHYIMSSFSGTFLRQFSYKRRAGAGIDVFYDETTYDDAGVNEKGNIGYAMRYGIHLSHEFIIMRLAIIANLGTYVYYQNEPLFPVYTRLGLRYRIAGSLYAGTALKAHLGVADYIEWGIGYYL